MIMLLVPKKDNKKKKNSHLKIP
uniref:Uncharacterized protein n=1 Tax=Rhizophora mucronata TaxID=61149 RepID=A0A2P2QEG8_RHIMU